MILKKTKHMKTKLMWDKTTENVKVLHTSMFSSQHNYAQGNKNDKTLKRVLFKFYLLLTLCPLFLFVQPASLKQHTCIYAHIVLMYV